MGIPIIEEITEFAAGTLGALIGLLQLIIGITTGAFKTITEYQHSHPMAFTILGVLIVFFVAGTVYVSGDTVTGFFIGKYRVLSPAEYEQAVGHEYSHQELNFNVPEKLTYSDLELVIAENRTNPWVFKPELFQGTERELSEYLRHMYYNSMCPHEFSQPGTAPAVWQVTMDIAPTGVFDTWYISHACGGLEDEVTRLSFDTNAYAFANITEYADNGLLCSDFYSITMIEWGIEQEGCYFIVDNNNHRVFYSTPVNPPYPWVPSVFSGGYSGVYIKTGEEEVVFTSGSKGPLSGLITMWYDSKNTVRDVEVSISPTTQIASVIFSLFEQSFYALVLIAMGIAGLVSLTTFWKFVD